ARPRLAGAGESGRAVPPLREYKAPTTVRPHTRSAAGRLIRLGTACHAPAPPHPGAWNALSYPRTVAARHLPGPARRTLLAQSVHRDIRRQTARRQVRMADRTEDRTLRLQVAGAKPQDVGRGTA